MEEQLISVGDKVRVLIDTPNGEILDGTVKAVTEEPGKLVGVELDHYVIGGHSLDGLVDEKVDETRGITVGRGWWTRPENLELL